MKIIMLVFLVMLATFAIADVEVHIAEGQADFDSAYETVAGVENSTGTAGAYGWRGLLDVNLTKQMRGYECTSMSPYTDPWNWTYFTSGAQDLRLGDDEVSNFIPLGFNISFYGKSYNKVRISSNGFVTFANSTNHGCCQGQNLPDPAAPNDLVAGWWEDLLPASAGGKGKIRFEKFILPSGVKRFIVEFWQVAHYGYILNNVTFQIILEECGGA